MMTSAPRIGFDRFISVEWATAALKVRAGVAQIDDLETVLDAAGLGAAARTKTRTVLNRLWLEPRLELKSYADRGAAIFKAYPEMPAATVHWGMAVATYPFFGKVAELIGRLSALQGDCASAEVHRRMSETYGEREGTYRMTNMVIQSQADWGAVQRAEKGKRVFRLAPTVVENDELTVWLIEAALRYAGKPARNFKPSIAARAFPIQPDTSLGLPRIKQRVPGCEKRWAEQSVCRLARHDLRTGGTNLNMRSGRVAHPFFRFARQNTP